MRASLLVCLLGCAATAGPRQIAGDLARQLRFMRDDWPLSARCQVVEDVQAWCVKNGLSRDCAWDGWHDADDDNFTIQACLERQQSP